MFQAVRSSSTSRRRSSTTTTTEGRSCSASRQRRGSSTTNYHDDHHDDRRDVEQHRGLVVHKSMQRKDSDEDNDHGGGGDGGGRDRSRGKRGSNHESGDGGGGRNRSTSKKKTTREPMVRRVTISDVSNQEGTTADEKEPVAIVLDMIDGMEMRREVTFPGGKESDNASDGPPELTPSLGSSDEESPPKKSSEFQLVPRAKKQQDDGRNGNDKPSSSLAHRRRCSSASKCSRSSSHDRRRPSSRSPARGRRSSSASRSTQSRTRSSSGGSNRSSGRLAITLYRSSDVTNDDTEEIDMKQKQPKTTKGPHFFRTIKKFASKVKNTLTELGGIHSVHRYSVGETARYKVGKVPKTLRYYDADTKTVEGTCCSSKSMLVLKFLSTVSHILIIHFVILVQWKLWKYTSTPSLKYPTTPSNCQTKCARRLAGII